VLALPKLFFDETVFEWSTSDVDDIELLLLEGAFLGEKKSLTALRWPECELELLFEIFVSARCIIGLVTVTADDKEFDCLLMAARAQTSKASWTSLRSVAALASTKLTAPISQQMARPCSRLTGALPVLASAAEVAESARRSDMQPQRTTGASGRCLLTSAIHLFLTLYSEIGSEIL
jgi:hypothetical protein